MSSIPYNAENGNEISSGSLQVIRQSIQKVPEIKACSIWDV